MAGHAVLTAQRAEDGIAGQGWESCAPDDHAVRGVLFDRQLRTLRGHVRQEHLDGLSRLGIDGSGVPDVRRMNERRGKATGREVVAVPELTPFEIARRTW